MSQVLASLSAPGSTLADGFGRRVRGIDPEVGDEVELLELSSELVEHDGFVSALGERVARFSSVRHASYVHLRRLDRPDADRLSLVSDYTPGWRLSELLSMSAETNTVLETTVVMGLLRQLLPAVSLFSRHNRESAIGALAPERLIVTPQARLVIPEHAFGSALEKLNIGRDRCWREYRIAMPPSAGLPRANARADTNALGVVALSLVLGRILDESEYPSAMQGLIETATERRRGETMPLSAAFAQWITRALQFEVRNAFQTPHEAQVAFEAVLASDRGYVTTPIPLERWVTDMGAAVDAASAPPPPPEPEPPAAEAEAATEPPLPAFVTEMPMMVLDVPAPLAAAPVEEPAVEESWAPQPPAAESYEPPAARVLVDDQHGPVEVALASESEPEAPEALEADSPEAAAIARERAEELRRAAFGSEGASPEPEALSVSEAPEEASAAEELSAAEIPEGAAAANEVLDQPQHGLAEASFGREGGLFATPAPETVETHPAASMVASPFKSPLVMFLITVVALMAVAVAWLWIRPAPDSLVGEGELVVNSRPIARISIDGTDRGPTPQTLRLSAGTHVLELQIGKTEPRIIPLIIRAGVQTSQYIELQNVPLTGGLDIRSDPVGARVLVDGQPRGTTPAALKDLPPGDHEVVLELGGRKVTQMVHIDAGVAAQMVVSMPRK